MLMQCFAEFFDKEISSVSGGYDYDAYLYDLRRK